MYLAQKGEVTRPQPQAHSTQGAKPRSANLHVQIRNLNGKITHHYSSFLFQTFSAFHDFIKHLPTRYSTHYYNDLSDNRQKSLKITSTIPTKYRKKWKQGIINNSNKISRLHSRHRHCHCRPRLLLLLLLLIYSKISLISKPPETHQKFLIPRILNSSPLKEQPLFLPRLG